MKKALATLIVLLAPCFALLALADYTEEGDPVEEVDQIEDAVE